MKNFIKSALTTLISATLLLTSSEAMLLDHSIKYPRNISINPWDIKNAVYYSIDSDGKIIDFEEIPKDFFIDDFVIIESITGDEFYSHLTIYLKDGSNIGFSPSDIMKKIAAT